MGSGVKLNDSRPRTAICATTQNNIIMLTAHNLSLIELASQMLSLGCNNAMNLDGGGSTAMSLADEVIYDQGRAVVTAVLLVDTVSY
ncbi:phosphodiester glycosidase family protein [Pseudoalteromonas haloplanktis]|uniref:Phosphodiester glycosidase family protein n=1 Tax=Pseudoalteromonas haloplanktis TaxID=228 RepID=A0ABU1B8U6_PSEHA|nr:phosphodiester glycosidase family protein [Pseudoalteromonas haloplanktis]MDQ9090211.1 phosphodiester glycosidase family protein [Pseudoalteromonas haloplanktis]